MLQFQYLLWSGSTINKCLATINTISNHENISFKLDISFHYSTQHNNSFFDNRLFLHCRTGNIQQSKIAIRINYGMRMVPSEKATQQTSYHSTVCRPEVEKRELEHCCALPGMPLRARTPQKLETVQSRRDSHHKHIYE